MVRSRQTRECTVGCHSLIGTSPAPASEIGLCQLSASLFFSATPATPHDGIIRCCCSRVLCCCISLLFISHLPTLYQRPACVLLCYLSQPGAMGFAARVTAPYAGEFDPTSRYVTSWLLPPGALFALRAIFSLYAFTTIFFIFGWNGSHGDSEDSRHSFSYFTHLTYWGLAFYYAFSAMHTAAYWLKGISFLARWPKALQIAHSMFYSTIVVYPWLVTGKSISEKCRP